MKMIDMSPNSEKPCEEHKIKLEPEQASKVPFPPGCQVVVLDESRNICSGKVAAVYISFSHDSGSCDNCYQVVFTDHNGGRTASVVRGSQLRFGINCPITISTPGCETEAIEGVIKGFEVQSEDSSEDQAINAFLYTVEVSAAINASQSRLYRQRGIGPEHIRFRPALRSHSLYDDKTTIISFDETSESKNQVEKVVNSNSCSSPIMASNIMKTSESPPKTSVDNQDEPLKPYTRCIPLQSPIPIHFQGDMKKFQDEKVPEFTLLVNFPLNNNKLTLPLGKKCCVMCGSLRWVSSSNRHKGKPNPDDSAFIPNQNKGLCTFCDVNVWVVNQTKMQIKWCKGCKNFQTWASFGEKGSATKCIRCRDRQREKYAAIKKKERGSGLKRKVGMDEVVEVYDSRKKISAA